MLCESKQKRLALDLFVQKRADGEMYELNYLVICNGTIDDPKITGVHALLAEQPGSADWNQQSILHLQSKEMNGAHHE